MMLNKVGRKCLLLSLMISIAPLVLAKGNPALTVVSILTVPRIYNGIDTKQLKTGSLLIVNNDDKAVTFQLRNNRGIWSSQFQTLEANEQRIYESSSATAIKLSTDNKPPVIHSLKDKNRYQIFWDASTQQLDIKKFGLGK